MDESKAIPQGYMSVGQLAKRMNITVRTLQYYDREGLFSPSAVSEGGRRLYTDTDIVKLHQILSMKHLGFSLSDIKGRLIALESPEDVAAALGEQAEAIRKQLTSLGEILTTIEALKAEVLEMQSVNFKKYADIIVNLRMKNELYWAIKHFDDSTLDHIRSRFDEESGAQMIETFGGLFEQAIQMHSDGIAPDSEEGFALAKSWWDMVMQFTGGDMKLLPNITAMANELSRHDTAWQQKQAAAFAFLEPALEAYFIRLNYNPFAEEQP